MVLIDETKFIMDKYGISKHRFISGFMFANMIVDGKNATDSYIIAFDVAKNEAKTLASQLRKTQWVQDIILFLKPDADTQYFGHKEAIIGKAMDIIDSKNADNKDILDAIKAVGPYLNVGKESKVKPIDEVNADKNKINLVLSVMEGIRELSNKNKMIASNGDIIDVVPMQ